jgi:hypothetical protein
VEVGFVEVIGERGLVEAMGEHGLFFTHQLQLLVSIHDM